MRITKPLRGSRPTQKLDLSPITQVIGKSQRMSVYAQIAIVVLPDGESAHYHKTSDDVLVWVQLQPEGHEVQARLGSAGGGRIPSIDDEVLVICPAGRLDFLPIIADTVTSGAVPSRLSDDKTIVEAPDEIQLIVGSRVIKVESGAIKLGDNAVEANMKGTSYKAAEQAFLALLSTFVSAVSTCAALPAPSAPQVAALTAATTALTAGITAFSSGAHLSTTVKTE